MYHLVKTLKRNFTPFEIMDKYSYKFDTWLIIIF